MKQDRLTRHTKDGMANPSFSEVSIDKERESLSTLTIDIDLADFKTHPLWSILVETTRRSPLYPGLVGYIRENIMPNNPNISPRELASKLSISIGEALVILDSLK